MHSKEKNKEEIHNQNRKSLLDKVIDHVCIPVYKPENRLWEVTFQALGWNRSTLEDFWTLFCRINKSRTGEITILEFLNYFDLERSEYVEKSFDYFDTTGGDSVDFLEFMISVWNICTMKVDTLTNFTFDIYDLDSDGELSLPEIERMVLEVYGTDKVIKSRIGNDVFQDIIKYAEDRGGVLSLTSFSIYTMNHSMLLFPIFRIQRMIQQRIMGVQYWKNVERKKMAYFDRNKKSFFDPRHVQLLLRTYKTRAAAGAALKQQFDLDSEEESQMNQNVFKSYQGENGKDEKKFKYERFKTAIEKVKVANAELKARKRENPLTKRMKNFEIATNAFIAAGEKAMTSLSKSKLSQASAKLNTLRKNSRKNELTGSLESSPTSQEKVKDNVHVIAPIVHSAASIEKKQTAPLSSYVRHKQKKKIRPKSAPINQVQRKSTNQILFQNRSTMIDHRKSSLNLQLRPRTPGSLVYVVDVKGDYKREKEDKS